MNIAERKEYCAPMLIDFVVAVERGFKDTGSDIDDFVEVGGSW